VSWAGDDWGYGSTPIGEKEQQVDSTMCIRRRGKDIAGVSIFFLFLLKTGRLWGCNTQARITRPLLACAGIMNMNEKEEE